jgi:hypothetical protein
VIGPSQIQLFTLQQTQKKNSNARSGIQTRDSSYRAALDLTATGIGCFSFFGGGGGVKKNDVLYDLLSNKRSPFKNIKKMKFSGCTLREFHV